jgi:uncharacterized coiled-coil DUF342 family protein
MDSRELYKQKYQAQMNEWSSKLALLKAQADKLTVQAKLDVKRHVDTVQAKFDAARAKLSDIGEASDDKWDGVVKEVDRSWRDLKAAADGAFEAMKNHKQD